MERLLGIGLIGAEGQVDHDQRMGRGPHHRLSVQDHHLERDTDRRRQAVHDHAERITDEQQIAIGVEQRRHRRRVGGEADDFLAPLAGCDVRRGDTLRAGLSRHDASGRNLLPCPGKPSRPMSGGRCL